MKGISGTDCLRFASQNKIQEFNSKKEECLKHRSEHATTPLMLATANGHVSMMEYLLAQGANVNDTDSHGDTALNYAVARNQLGAARLLIEKGARVISQRQDGISSLMQALQFGTKEMVLTLMSDSEAINQPAEDGWTPLYFAIRRQDEGLLEELIRRGACTNIFDTYKQTPLDFAKEVKWQAGIKMIEKSKPCRGSS